jgi:hypothetical protein
MRVIIAFLLGIVVTVGAAYVRDNSMLGPTDKPLVNWDQVNGITHNAADATRNEWNKLTK